MVITNVDAEKDDNIPHHARGVAFMSGGGSISARGSISKSGEGGNVKWGGHIGPTLVPEAILFESPCRAHSET